GEVPAPGLAPGVGEGVRNEPQDKCPTVGAGSASGHTLVAGLARRGRRARPPVSRPGRARADGLDPSSADGGRLPCRDRRRRSRQRPCGWSLMSDRINQSPIAPPSYTTDFSLQERLQDLLSYAEVTGRLTEDEVDLVAHSVTDEARSRHAIERQGGEYWQWRADGARRHREGSRRAEREPQARRG